MLKYSIIDSDREKLCQNPRSGIPNFRNAAGVEVADSVEEKLRTRLLHQAIIRAMRPDSLQKKKRFPHNSD